MARTMGEYFDDPFLKHECKRQLGDANDTVLTVNDSTMKLIDNEIHGTLVKDYVWELHEQMHREREQHKADLMMLKEHYNGMMKNAGALVTEAMEKRESGKSIHERALAAGGILFPAPVDRGEARKQWKKTPEQEKSLAACKERFHNADAFSRPTDGEMYKRLNGPDPELKKKLMKAIKDPSNFLGGLPG